MIPLGYLALIFVAGTGLGFLAGKDRGYAKGWDDCAASQSQEVTRLRHHVTSCIALLQGTGTENVDQVSEHLHQAMEHLRLATEGNGKE